MTCRRRSSWAAAGSLRMSTCFMPAQFGASQPQLKTMRAGSITCLALSGSGAMARIVDHLPVAALEARYRAARDVSEARHYQAIWLLAQGRSFLEVGEVMAFAPRCLEELAARYNTHGPAALGDQRRRNGRAAKEVLAALAER